MKDETTKSPLRLPAGMRVEAKFTTSKAVGVPRRELEALVTVGGDVLGLVAVLFRCGDPALDGQWIVVDAAESFRRGDGEVASLNAAHLYRLRNTQPWLAAVHAHLERSWKPFLAAFADLALAGHEPLKATLEELHRENRLAAQLPAADVLDLEHRRNVDAIVEKLGEHVAGHVFQDLLAYLLGLAGYRTVQVNPVGVPDIEVSDLATGQATGEAPAATPPVRLELTPQEIETLARLAREAGETSLAERLRA